MKVLAVAILKNGSEPVVVAQAQDLSQFGFFEKKGVREMLTFFTKTVVKRIKAGQRMTVEVEDMAEYQVHAFVRADGLSATATADKEYPTRAAFALLGQILDDYAGKMDARGDAPEYPIEAILAKAQDPANFDKITKIQQDLDDTTQVLHQTIDNLLERGEKLDNLVERSDDLSKQSKMFYKQARKTNSCCVIA
ncbi:hypothetical protein CTAYLR_004497 [Chrysophaeum taylorii]|uniref:Uncharacterized protein n=1 Tax=Chrysophaeum taylorii TaxID=2483200 RepID=A0AAD7XK26_9STRA|nr:hypothetical protein CTAYLR_004497 [Chrysophaeum taylorii]